MNHPAATDQMTKAGGVALRLRPERADDEDFLRHLFSETHGGLLAGLDPSLVAMLLRLQQTGQTMTYRSRFPGACFDVVVHDDIPVGRLVVDECSDVLHVVDIALLPGARGRGLGRALIAAVMRRADDSGRGVTASVRDDNAASRALFSHLGFVFRPLGLEVSEAIWRPSPA